MWAPADLLTPAIDAVLLSARTIVSYFAEHLLILLAAIVALAALIALAGRRMS